MGSVRGMRRIGGQAVRTSKPNDTKTDDLLAEMRRAVEKYPPHPAPLSQEELERFWRGDGWRPIGRP